eukprot:CAMPEP_0170830364 /NCGR_PEP_ID=MMETSP0733-20121128/49258_1 /TAXON_ID=186038 /ORGANISM="Fragilariopsis kerguelensis, Strain L26-C5" /LENGTH=82 /DNA_ID=CAMNT_0011195595 /DNA_START=189 /DNA_END=436 /DNA_ORIENTATION=+
MEMVKNLEVDIVPSVARQSLVSWPVVVISSSGLLFIFTSDYPGKQQLQELRHDEAATKKENDRSTTVPSAAAQDADDADDDI